MQFLVLILCFLIHAVVSRGSDILKQQNRLMVWMCLEFCDESADIIESNMQQIANHQHSISAVSFEKYTLGANSTLVDNHLTEVASKINALNLEAWPLLSSFPHPPEFIDWMRTVFVNPDPFIQSCIAKAKRFHYFGYNLDWEPTDDVTADDGAAYAKFISYFADELHKVDLKLTVDVATWSPIWNYNAIAATNVEVGISMGTYTSTDTSFTSQLNQIVTAFGPNRAGVGLETVNASSNALLPLDEVKWRFQQVLASGTPSNNGLRTLFLAPLTDTRLHTNTKHFDCTCSLPKA